MFGFVRANIEDLTQEEKERYKTVYCGVCHSLGERYTFTARMGLNYDLTFVALLLSSLYEPKEKVNESRCVVHPFKKHTYVSNKYIDYAADMTVALMYHKCIDDWKDDKNYLKRCYSLALSKSYEVVKNLWPTQCEYIERELSVIADIEKSSSVDPDVASKSFGRLLSAIFAINEDLFTPYLQRIGYGLGRYIYLADAAIDLHSDIKKGSYNPLKYVSADNKSVEMSLKIILGEASEAFEALPLVQDEGLLRNILYSGVWLKYNLGMQKERKKKNGK